MGEPSNPKLIYVVDVNDDDRLLLEYDCENYGIDNCLRFFPGVDNLIQYYNTLGDRHPPGIILLDGFMKEEPIGNAISILKSVPDFQAVPIVLMIGSKYEKEYFKPYNLNISGYVVKPINVRILVRFLKMCQ